MCCGVEPELRIGCGISTLKCPKCGAREGAWCTNAEAARSAWNHNKVGWDRSKHEGVRLTGGEDLHYFTCLEFTAFYFATACGIDSSDVNRVNVWDVVMRHERGNSDFEFRRLRSDGTPVSFKLSFNPPKSGGSVSYLDGGLDSNNMKDVSGIRLSAHNFKWSRRLMPSVLFLRESCVEYWEHKTEEDKNKQDWQNTKED